MFRVREQIGCREISDRYTGEGVTAAVLDTGIAPHPDLEGRITDFFDFVNGKAGIYDDSGHGTHVCGILAGNGTASAGKYKGIATGCSLVVGKVLNGNGDGSVDHMLMGIDWVLANRHRFQIRILNISVGLGQIQENTRKGMLLSKIEEAWERGVVVVVAAGNGGPLPGSISPIGASRQIVTVGCHDGGYFGNRESLCENYSGRGPSEYAYKKPDVVAPGTDIISCGNHCRKSLKGWQNAYVTKSGTSMAAPVVSGALALYLQKNPQADNETVKRKLMYSAIDLKEPWTKQGWGMVNAARLLMD